MSMHYVSTKPLQSGQHEVHQKGCTRLPNPENRLYIGAFSSGGSAIRKAKQTFSTANGCSHCMAEQHA